MIYIEIHLTCLLNVEFTKMVKKKDGDLKTDPFGIVQILINCIFFQRITIRKIHLCLA